MKHIIISLTSIMSLLIASFASAAVDINSASQEELVSALKGIGDKKAEAIIQYRDSHGAFSSVDALLAVTGIGAKFIEDNRENISLGRTTS